MKKILFFLAIFLGLANSLFAVDLSTHERAKIVTIVSVDGYAYKYAYNPDQNYDSLSYPYWNASYPYNSLKYSGRITGWYGYNLNPNAPRTNYIYVEMPNYSPVDFWLQRYGHFNERILEQRRFSQNGKTIIVFKDLNANDVNTYEMITQINTSVGTSDLYCSIGNVK